MAPRNRTVLELHMGLSRTGSTTGLSGDMYATGHMAMVLTSQPSRGTMSYSSAARRGHSVSRSHASYRWGSGCRQRPHYSTPGWGKYPKVWELAGQTRWTLSY